MRTFAHKPNAIQQTMPATFTIPGRAHIGQSHEVNSSLHMQRMIGNQAVLRMLQPNAEELEVGLAKMATPRFQYDFSQIPLHSEAPHTIQPTLKIGTPNDMYEQEADRVAEQVMHMPEPGAVQTQTSPPKNDTEKKPIQVEPAARQITPLLKQPSGATKSTENSHRSTPDVTSELASSVRSFQGTGQSLPESLRPYFESRFGYDFSHVRLHTNSRAKETAHKLNARAFTLGRDIVFGAGAYAPASKAGQRLLAHELAHVVQQRRALGAYNSSVHGMTIQRIETKHPQRGGLYPTPTLAPTQAQILSGIGCLRNRYSGGRLLVSLPMTSCPQVSTGGFTVNLFSYGLDARQFFLKGGTWLDIVNLDNAAHTIILAMPAQPKATPKPTSPKLRPKPGATPKSTGLKSRPKPLPKPGPIPKSIDAESRPKPGPTPKSTGPKSRPKPRPKPGPTPRATGSTSQWLVTFYNVRPCTILRINFAPVPQLQTGRIMDYPSMSAQPVTVCP